MASYQFKCGKCEKTETVVCSFKELDEQKPECCGEQMDRVYTAPSVFFYGSGFSKNEK